MMINFISGKLVEKSVNSAVVENGGIGYDLMISGNTAHALPDLGQTIRLFTYLQVSAQSDQIMLFGFINTEERNLFKTLISISGIGAKGAIKMLSGISPKRFAEVVAAEDVDFLTKLPGIGKKSAQRIIVELREKLPALGEKKESIAGLGSDRAEEVIQALISLGMSPQESKNAIEKVVQKVGSEKAKDLPAEEIIRKALSAGR